MTSRPVSGVEGYAEDVERAIALYEGIRADEYHRSILHLIPKAPARILDVGAGTGRDAAWLADMGHQVVAVEPTDRLRDAARSLHPSPAIEWLNDFLPDLAILINRAETFDAVMVTGVWHHLDEQERRQGMANLASLLHGGGALAMTLRHGPAPATRRLFGVSAEETIALATSCGLELVINSPMESALVENRAAGVTWTRLAFEKI
jgi:SAM-dependent methyltransferase